MERTQHSDSGGCIWLREAVNRPRARPLLRSPASWPSCFIDSGPPRSPTSPSTNQPPNRYPCLPVATTPCSDDCVRVLAFQGRLRNGSIDSPLEPQSAPSLLHTSSSECEYKPGGEQHATQRQQQEQRPGEVKSKDQRLTPVTCSYKTRLSKVTTRLRQANSRLLLWKPHRELQDTLRYALASEYSGTSHPRLHPQAASGRRSARP